jgi:hypothetical protein
MNGHLFFTYLLLFFVLKLANPSMLFFLPPILNFLILLQNLKPELMAYENIFTSQSIVGIDFLSPGE